MGCLVLYSIIGSSLSLSHTSNFEQLIMMEEDLESLLHLRQNGKLNEAITGFQQLLQENPDCLTGWVELGRTFDLAGDRHQACDCFQSVLTRHPKHYEAHLRLTQTLAKLERFPEALQQLQVALTFHSNNFMLLMVQGELLEQQKQVAAAVDLYLALLRAYPNRQEALKRILRCASQTGHLERDITLLETIRLTLFEVYPQLEKWRTETQTISDRAAPHSSESLPNGLPNATIEQGFVNLSLWISERYRQQRRFQTACDYCQRVLEMEPDHVWATTSMAIALQEWGKWDKAKGLLQDFLSRHPANVNGLMQLAKLEASRQQWTTALEYVERAHQIEPNHLWLQFEQIKLLRQLRQFDRVNAILNQLEQAYPNDSRVLNQKGLVARQQGKRQLALKAFRKTYALEQNWDTKWFIIEELLGLHDLDAAKNEITASPVDFQDQLRTQLLLGRILQQALAFHRAIEVYEEIFRRDPHHQMAKCELAYCLSQVGQTEHAIELLLELFPGDGPGDGPREEIENNASMRAMLQLGGLYQALDRWDDALSWYEMAYQRYPYSSKVCCTFANFLVRRGENGRALALLEQAEAQFPDVIDIPLQRAALRVRWGDIAQAQGILSQASQSHADYIPLLLQHCRAHIQWGDFDGAIATLNKIDTDQHHWRKQIEQLRGEIALQQYDFDRAEAHYQASMALRPVTPHDHIRLAQVLMLNGAIEAAYHQLEQATKALEQKRPPGDIGLPIKNHVAMVINEFRMNPPMMAQLLESQEEGGRDRLQALGSLLVQEPTFLGTSIYLIKELRVQGVFDQLQQFLAGHKAAPSNSIPKRIVQFWDDPRPPDDVCRLGQSWVDQNPDYEYKRFSLVEAIAFLKSHYDDDVLKAFRLCNHAATQSDFFRLAYLNKMGGFYADADDRCLHSLEGLRSSQAELVVFQEDFACLGNNFLGCVPGQAMIRAAFYHAVSNLLNYSAEWAWSQTGPGLLTSVVCSGLVPYLGAGDHRMWPRLWVMTRGELTSYVWVHVQLSYKGTDKSWQSHAYPKTQLSSRPLS